MKAVVLFVVVVGLAHPLVAVEPEPPLQEVRQHLRNLDPPWYDAERDAWKRMDIAKPAEKGSVTWTALVAWTLLAAVVIALALLIADLLRHWRPDFGAAGDQAGDRTKLRAIDFSALPFQVDESADPAREVEAAFAAGDWSRVVVWTYVLVLLRLDQAGIIHLGPGATDRGCLRQARSAVAEGRPRAAAEHLETIVAIFERSYFGHVAATASEAEIVRAGYRDLMKILADEERQR